MTANQVLGIEVQCPYCWEHFELLVDVTMPIHTEDDLEETLADVGHFAKTLATTIQSWRDRLTNLASAGQRVDRQQVTVKAVFGLAGHKPAPGRLLQFAIRQSLVRPPLGPGR